MYELDFNDIQALWKFGCETVNLAEQAQKAKHTFKLIPEKTAQSGSSFTEIAKQLKQSFAQVKIVEKSEVGNRLQEALYRAIEKVAPTQASTLSGIEVTPKAILQATTNITQEVLKFYPVEFSPKAIPDIIDIA
ncbi:hypothetical protein LCGC14_1778130, partial [marine sediment metagenome]